MNGRGLLCLRIMLCSEGCVRCGEMGWGEGLNLLIVFVMNEMRRIRVCKCYGGF